MKLSFFRPFFLTLLFLSCTQGCSNPDDSEEALKSDHNVVLRLDASVQYQSIQGFGGFGAEKVWWAEPPFFSQEYIDLLLHDLGVSILRDSIPIGFEVENDNDDPRALDLSKFNLYTNTYGDDSHLNQHLEYLVAMHESGLEKLIVSIWSPPIWMKHNDHRGNGSDNQERRTEAPPYSTVPTSSSNQLKEALYEEFAEYCVAYIRTLKQRTGIDLYAISLQNEPRFSQFYASAVYSPEALRDIIKVVGKRFNAEGIPTKIFAPEDVQDINAVTAYISAIFNDPEAKQHTDIVAIHNYKGDGIRPADEVPSHWRQTADLAKKNNKEIWMTETSGFDKESFDGALALAISMYNALHYGDVSAWVYWQMSSSFFVEGNLNTPNGLYYASKHFYRHIRPGAQRIKIVSDDERLLALAFQQDTQNTEVIILINTSDQPLNVSFNRVSFNNVSFDNDNHRDSDSAPPNTQLGDYEVILSDPSSLYKIIPEPQRLTESFSMPGQSIATLYKHSATTP